MGKLLPIVLAIFGTGAGIGAGLFLTGDDMPPDQIANDNLTAEQSDTAETSVSLPQPNDPDAAAGREYVRLTNQFVVPVMGPDRVQALVVASLSVEVLSGTTEDVYAREPKLRDVFLQVLFDHANIGGFEGAFTSADRMDILRRGLLEAARGVLGNNVGDVLITEIARQDS